MKGMRNYKQLLISALLVSIFLGIGGCSPKVLVPPEMRPEQRAYIRGSHGVYLFGGTELLAVDGKELLFENSAYILPGKHKIRVSHERSGSGYANFFDELQFTAEAGHDYIAKCHYSWLKSCWFFSVEDEQTGNVVSDGGDAGNRE